MPPDRDPDHCSFDGHTVTHHHRRHPIDPIDDYPDVIAQHAALPHDGQPVTVSDLLDALNADLVADRSGNYRDEFDVLHNLRASAPHDVRRSYFAIKSAIDDHHRLQHRIRALSAEERAEFDRRTT